jgi:hypothetical protein
VGVGYQNHPNPLGVEPPLEGADERPRSWVYVEVSAARDYSYSARPPHLGEYGVPPAARAEER